MSTSICPCGSGNLLDACCGHYHAGHPAPCATALMRSRYSAYVLGLVDYLVVTTLPAQQAGLEKALSEVTANCNEATLKKERENKVLDAKHDVSRRQADLDKAMKKGDPDKINKRKDKLAESRKELQEALDQLDQ